MNVRCWEERSRRSSESTVVDPTTEVPAGLIHHGRGAFFSPSGSIVRPRNWSHRRASPVVRSWQSLSVKFPEMLGLMSSPVRNADDRVRITAQLIRTCTLIDRSINRSIVKV